MPLGNFPIIKRMRWCDLYNACTEVSINHFVGNYLNSERAVDAFYFQGLPNVFFVALVVRMYGYGGVAELGFWPGGGQRERSVFHVVQRSFELFVRYFDIGKAGAVV